MRTVLNPEAIGPYSEALARLTQQKILVLGDLMIDQWMWGKVSRISPEAPVPVVDVEKTTYTPGGAANVVSNLLSLGCRVTVAGLVGDDESGERLCSLLRERGAQTSGTFKSKARRTTVKTRIIAHSQQVVRVDQEERKPFSREEASDLEDWLKSNSEDFDGIFLSDYDKGFFTCPSLVDLLPRLINGKVPVIAGPKPANLTLFRGVNCLTLNAFEASVSTGLPVDDDHSTETAGLELLKLIGAQAVLVTRGERGMTFFQHGAPPIGEPALATEVFDVSGAGDTVLTVLGLGLCAGIDNSVAVKLASHAAAVVVRKLGTATVTAPEIVESLRKRG